MAIRDYLKDGVIMSTMLYEIKHTPKLGWEISFVVLLILVVLIIVS